MAGTIPSSSLRSRSWDTLSRHVLSAFDRLLAKDHDDLDATEYTRKKDTKCNSPPSFKPWYADFLPNVGRYSSFRIPLIVASSKSSRATPPSPLPSHTRPSIRPYVLTPLSTCPGSSATAPSAASPSSATRTGSGWRESELEEQKTYTVTVMVALDIKPVMGASQR